MSIVLKDTATGLYLKNGVAYTPDPGLALPFDSVARAQRFCATHRFKKIHPVPAPETDAQLEYAGAKAA